METITHSQIQELIARLPIKKLPLAYSLLRDLAEQESGESSPQDDFMLLPLSERRKIMAQQAAEIVEHYEKTGAERQEWQSGDFVDGY